MALTNPKKEKLTPEEIVNKFQSIDKFFTAVIVILIISVITLLVTVSGIVIDSYRFKATYYQDTLKEMRELNRKIDSYNTDYFINSKMEELKNKNPYLK